MACMHVEVCFEGVPLLRFFVLKMDETFVIWTKNKSPKAESMCGSFGCLFLRGVRLSPLIACRKPPRMCYACWWTRHLPVWWTWFLVMKRRVLVTLGSGVMIFLCLKKRGSNKARIWPKNHLNILLMEEIRLTANQLRYRKTLWILG